MPRLFTELSLSAQTAYAQLLDATLGAEHARSVADLPGSFNAKTVKGRRYWYFQYTEPSGKLRQVYVGPDGEAVQRLMQRKAEANVSAALQPSARSALALGCAGILPRHFRVVRRLADYGLFRAGGVLVGTHAFLAFGNMLGVKWSSIERTQDIDLAHPGKSISLVLPGDDEARVDDAISSLEMGFLPVAGLGGSAGATYLIPKEPEFRLDFLTPLHRGGDRPFSHPRLGVPLQPLPFMEFSLEGVEQAVLFCPEGAVLVNVPDPARFALHKLLVHAERKGAFRSKSNKDLAQSAHLLDYLWIHRRAQLGEAVVDLLGRGPGWVSRFRQGVDALSRVYPALEVSSALVGAVESGGGRGGRRAKKKGVPPP
jgi:hypothetical protein